LPPEIRTNGNYRGFFALSVEKENALAILAPASENVVP